ncbi:MAG TPA: alpha/beta hydrolase [Candidatus Aquilonibacter sp.]|nr:alpha/beta hydrolase [Candidatus Aquilonibacter sp.]
MFGFVLAAALAVSSPMPSLPTPSASFQSGTLHVDRYGHGGTALVFVPGLGCCPWSWAEQIARFSKNNTVYAVTLAGFDGTPFTPQSDLTATFENDFWGMLASQHIDKPIVVGHSLGGTLAFALAESHPERLRAVVAVDGLPVFPLLAQSTPAQRKSAAQSLAASVQNETHDRLLAFERTYMKQIGTTHEDLIEPTAQLEAKSDPKAIAAWGEADMNMDLRPGLAKATLPIVELMPYAQPSPYSKDQTLAFYRMLVAGAPNVTVVPVEGSRHFAMLDAPQTVDAQITRVLSQAR